MKKTIIKHPIYIYDFRSIGLFKRILIAIAIIIEGGFNLRLKEKLEH